MKSTLNLYFSDAISYLFDSVEEVENLSSGGVSRARAFCGLCTMNKVQRTTVRTLIDALDPICWVMWLCFWLGCGLGWCMSHVFELRCIYPVYRVLMDLSLFIQDQWEYRGPWKRPLYRDNAND